MTRDDKTTALVRECIRQQDNATYTAASLFEWYKFARLLRVTFLLIPIVLGGFAASQLLADYGGEAGRFAGTLAGLIAGFFPSIYVALNLDMHVSEIQRSANEFTTIRDRFRQAAEVSSLGGEDEFGAAFEGLMDRMDSARASSPPVPEWCFKRAQKKIKAGDYGHDV